LVASSKESRGLDHGDRRPGVSVPPLCAKRRPKTEHAEKADEIDDECLRVEEFVFHEKMGKPLPFRSRPRRKRK